MVWQEFWLSEKSKRVLNSACRYIEVGNPWPSNNRVRSSIPCQKYMNFFVCAGSFWWLHFHEVPPRRLYYHNSPCEFFFCYWEIFSFAQFISTKYQIYLYRHVWNSRQQFVILPSLRQLAGFTGIRGFRHLQFVQSFTAMFRYVHRNPCITTEYLTLFSRR